MLDQDNDIDSPEMDDEERVRQAELRMEVERIVFREKVEKFLLQYYTTSSKPTEATFHFTTKEIWQQLQALFPSSAYGLEDVSLWLNAGGFKFYDFGHMKFEWLINKL